MPDPSVLNLQPSILFLHLVLIEGFLIYVNVSCYCELLINACLRSVAWMILSITIIMFAPLVFANLDSNNFADMPDV